MLLRLEDIKTLESEIAEIDAGQARRPLVSTFCFSVLPVVLNDHRMTEAFLRSAAGVSRPVGDSFFVLIKCTILANVVSACNVVSWTGALHLWWTYRTSDPLLRCSDWRVVV